MAASLYPQLTLPFWPTLSLFTAVCQRSSQSVTLYLTEKFCEGGSFANAFILKELENLIMLG